VLLGQRFQDLYERLLLHRLGTRSVGAELHVHGRRFMIRNRPGGLLVRTLATAAPVNFGDPDDVLAAGPAQFQVRVRASRARASCGAVACTSPESCPFGPCCVPKPDVAASSCPCRL
jgi:hypothetical protein